MQTEGRFKPHPAEAAQAGRSDAATIPWRLQGPFAARTARTLFGGSNPCASVGGCGQHVVAPVQGPAVQVVQQIGEALAGPGLARVFVVVARQRPTLRDAGGKAMAPADSCAAPGVVAHRDNRDGAERRSPAAAGDDVSTTPPVLR